MGDIETTEADREAVYALYRRVKGSHYVAQGIKDIETFRADAVKAERERWIEYAVSWMIANKNTECMDNTDVVPCVNEILAVLSDDQERENNTKESE